MTYDVNLTWLEGTLTCMRLCWVTHYFGSKVIQRSSSETLVVASLFFGDHDGVHHFGVKGNIEVKF